MAERKTCSCYYTVEKESLETYDDIPIFGLYQKFANNVTVEYKGNGKAMKDNYVVQTSTIVNHYMDNRFISDSQQTKVITMAGTCSRPGTL